MNIFTGINMMLYWLKELNCTPKSGQLKVEQTQF